ncbi:MAG TPA: flagellar motor switch protein FliN [Blastocatellia bacterium]|nr:flagellar motor switch protein FliN [Blastocatellia bacterium]
MEEPMSESPDSGLPPGVRLGNIDRLLDIEMDVIVRFGVTNMPLSSIVRLGPGSIIELNRAVDAPVDLLVNGLLIARGEVVVIDGCYGVRVTEITSPGNRAQSVF